MKKNILFFISILFIVILVSCEITPSEEGKDVNRYIFPYVEFTLSEDGSYFTASVIDGATPEEVYIPSYVTDSDTVKPVRFFDGFKSEKGEKAVKSVVFESSLTVPTSSALKNSRNLESIRYEKIASEDAVWESLYSMPQTEEEEFLGWFTESGEKVQNGDLMKSGSVKVYPKWGEHNYVTVEAKTPTCTTSGHNTYKVCSSCGYSTEVVWGAWGHNLREYETDGVGVATTIYKCSRCGLLFSDSSSRNRAYVYSISYDLFGGSLPEGTTNPSSYIRSENMALNRPVTIGNPKKAGFVFAGWNDGREGSNPTLTCVIDSETTGDTTLTATWYTADKNIVGKTLYAGKTYSGDHWFGKNGNYGDYSGKDVEWTVLDFDETNGRILLLSKYMLTYMEHGEYTLENYSWETSNIYKWLNNGDFVDNYKLEGIVEDMAEVDHVTEYDSTNEVHKREEGWSSGNGRWKKETKEKIYLLSESECSGNSRYAKNVELTYRTKQGDVKADWKVTYFLDGRNTFEYDDGFAAPEVWWLRDGTGAYDAWDDSCYPIKAYQADGVASGTWASNDRLGIRPAFWLNY